MSAPRSRALRAILFVGAHLAAAALVYLALLAPVLDTLQARRDEIAEKQVLLDKTRTARARLEAQAGLAPLDLPTATFLAGGSNEGSVAATFQARVKALVEPTGVVVRSQRAMQTRAQNRLTLSGERIELTGTITALARALHEIETSKAPALFVSAAILRAPPSTGAVTERSEPQIEAQLDLQTVLLREKGAP